MADENWQKVREIFDVALQKEPLARQDYILQSCGEDKNLLVDIESLFSTFDELDGFMEKPAVEEFAGVMETETKKLEKGKRFAHYEIIEQIGRGGMGEVYLARDKKLDRKVAIKILDEKFAGHESNLNRFISEAKAASALNHPNILTIYEFGESDDAHFIVSEFIKGKTLRQTLKEKSLSLTEVLDISIQIVGALSAAHETRLIHRDIKPENIMIRPDGYVKVLDFGLAKLVERKNQSILGLNESTLERNETAKGIILGTVNYMSPEQAKAEKVDQRTDIFSLGALIYEMIAGRTPFAADSISETFANLIKTEPESLSLFVANVPDELQRIVSKTLRKNKDERHLSIKDLLVDLKELRESLSLNEKFQRTVSSGNQATAVLQATTSDANKQTAETQNTFSQTIKQLLLLIFRTKNTNLSQMTKRRNGLLRGLKFLFSGLGIGFISIVFLQILHIFGLLLFQYESSLPVGSPNSLTDMIGNLLNMVLIPVLLGGFLGVSLFLSGIARIVYAVFEKENSKTNSSIIEHLRLQSSLSSSWRSLFRI